MLRKAGLISSIKGAQGGYSLSTKPDKISVGDILRALEGELTVTDQQEQGINSIQDCVRIRVWDQLNQHINDFVDSITLEDLVNEYNKQLSEGNYMYYI